MTIRHHLTDALLMAYAAGNLPEAFSLVAATHISMCAECRMSLAAFEGLGGAVIEAGEAIAMRESRLDAIWTRPVADRPAPAKATGVFPSALVSYVGGDLADVKWRAIGMGVRQAILPTSRSASARLLCIPAGQAVPDHGHRGVELTLVLQGAFHDNTDQFGRGDLEIADQALVHTPTAKPGLDCICLAATDAPLRFSAFLPRLLQPLFRI